MSTTQTQNPLKKHLIEAYSKIDESAHITGIALIPRISRNNNLYTKEELKRFHNVRVPLNWEHDPSKPIGTVTFYYNAETEQVYYEGMIEDDAAAVLAKNKTLFTSIEANPIDVKQVCNGGSDCFNMPFGLTPTALALTETPGVPETSVHVIENYIRECFHDHQLEDKYAPNQTNLKNEQHIEQIVASTDGAVGSASAVDDCLNHEITVISADNPDMPHDQVVARAITACANSETIKHLKMAMEHFCNDCGELHLPELKKNDVTNPSISS